MKKFFTLLCLIATVGGVSAQTSYRPIDGSAVNKMRVAPAADKKGFVNSSRSASSSFVLDYDGNDETYATNLTYTYSRYLWDINSRYPNSEALSMRYAAVFFDTLQYVDGNNALQFYPRSKSTVTLDSFDVLFVHNHVTNNNDSIKFTVFNPAAKVVTGYGSPTATFTTPSLWDTTIVVNSTIPLNTTNFTVWTFAPNVSMPQGQSFGIRIDFAGDTANKFQTIAGFRDECSEACQGEISVAGNNSAYYMNLITQTNQNLSGYFENDGQGAIYYDCDASGGYTVGGCENFPIQNWVIPAYVTATIDYGVSLSANKSFGCTNEQIDLTAAGFGSNATPFTYAWSTSSGNLTSNSGEQVSLILGTGNATVSVTVTDANNQTAVSSYTITPKGIGISITNATPITISCGSNVTLLTSTTGNQQGKAYSWSTGGTGPTLVASQPGNYVVTVTNNSGCSATATASVSYNGGITNTVNFTLPPSPNCEDKQLTFANTSSSKANWNFTWDFGDSQTSFLENGVNTYANPGQYNVKLTADSASCSFSSPTKSITILPSTNGACLSGIEDVTFNNAISMVPNPTNGNVTFNITAVEKNLNIRVYNIIGSEVKSFNASDVATVFTRSFDFSDLSNGTYLVKITSGDKTATKRLVVNK